MIKIIILTLDRIEGEYAVCIDDSENTYNLPLSLLPDEMNEGDVIECAFTVRPNLKKERSKRIHSLFEALKKKGERNEN